MSNPAQHIIRYAARQVPALDAMSVITLFIETIQIIQAEETKRAQIAKQRDVLIKALESERQVILAYFEQRFAERRQALDRFFHLLDYGITHHDTKSIDAALTGILGIIQDNPLRDFETFKKCMARPDFEIEF
ncbi:hypothetical protein [Chloroflexus sp.]|uniref:hypothetical protein n=1 Tax=Chloroflexus sp. TaxID=1904827 RepID=UPI0040492F39